MNIYLALVLISSVVILAQEKNGTLEPQALIQKSIIDFFEGLSDPLDIEYFNTTYLNGTAEFYNTHFKGLSDIDITWAVNWVSSYTYNVHIEVHASKIYMSTAGFIYNETDEYSPDVNVYANATFQLENLRTRIIVQKNKLTGFVDFDGFFHLEKGNATVVYIRNYVDISDIKTKNINYYLKNEFNNDTTMHAILSQKLRELVQNEMLTKLGFTVDDILKDGRTTSENIDAIKKWLQTQKLPKILDEQVVVFLLACKNNVEETKYTIVSHYRFKKNFPEVFNNRKVQGEEIQKVLNVVTGCVLPFKMNGHAVAISKFIDTNYKNFDLISYVKLVSMTYDTIVYEDPPDGLVIILDAEGLSFLHLTRFKIRFMKDFSMYVQEAAPLHIISLHIINCSIYMDMLYKIIRPFLKKEVIDRIHFHRGEEQMEVFRTQFIPKQYLPKDYGGDLDCIFTYCQHSTDKLLKMQEYFDLEEQQRLAYDADA